MRMHEDMKIRGNSRSLLALIFHVAGWGFLERVRLDLPRSPAVAEAMYIILIIFWQRCCPIQYANLSMMAEKPAANRSPTGASGMPDPKKSAGNPAFRMMGRSVLCSPSTIY